MKPTTEPTHESWQDLLEKAVSEPGLISKAYSAFHGYSIGNQMLAIVQCSMRRIQPGPISTYPGWKEKGRQVKKGEKAICLWMPITCKAKEVNDEGLEEERVFTRFMLKNNWFVLSQTEGRELPPSSVPGWDRETALQALEVSVIPFDHMDGNAQGYASGKSIAVNPVAENPAKTTFHELAHVVLGHTAESDMADNERTLRDLREVEAESVALILCDCLELPGAEYARGYIQYWMRTEKIPEKSAQKIFAAADAILKAGRQ